MSGYVWRKPGTKLTYRTGVTNDPNVPAGYILAATNDGSLACADGSTDDNSQHYVGGLYSGGFPPYNGYQDGSATNGKLS